MKNLRRPLEFVGNQFIARLEGKGWAENSWKTTTCIAKTALDVDSGEFKITGFAGGRRG